MTQKQSGDHMAKKKEPPKQAALIYIVEDSVYGSLEEIVEAGYVNGTVVKVAQIVGKKTLSTKCELT
jgi:hypothetical protein